MLPAAPLAEITSVRLVEAATYLGQRITLESAAPDQLMSEFGNRRGSFRT
jgi:hypothetical protein